MKFAKIQKTLVTSYFNPDIDGIGSAIAYAEFLVQNGIRAAPGVFGTPQQEVAFAAQTFGGCTAAHDTECAIADFSSIILVDACKIRDLPPGIAPEMVNEIIDHHKDNDAELFVNARIQIDLVGAAATLIAERFAHAHAPISKTSAGLLYSGIISNTVNLRAHVTTERDQTMHEWLRERTDLPANYIHNFFRAKSELTEPLKKIFADDITVRRHGNYTVAVAQLEIVDVDYFIDSRLQEIQTALSEIKTEESADYVFLSCVDVEHASNRFVFIDEETKHLVGQALGETFASDTPRRDGILMRKEITPLVGDMLVRRTESKTD